MNGTFQSATTNSIEKIPDFIWKNFKRNKSLQSTTPKLAKHRKSAAGMLTNVAKELPENSIAKSLLFQTLIL